MQKFESVDQLKEGKLYIIKTKEGQRPIVFRDGNEIRSNSHRKEDEPIRRFTETDILSFEEYLNDNT